MKYKDICKCDLIITLYPDAKEWEDEIIIVDPNKLKCPAKCQDRILQCCFSCSKNISCKMCVIDSFLHPLQKFLIREEMKKKLNEM